MKQRFVLIALCCGALALAGWQASLVLVVNGKTSKVAPIEQGGELFIPASALKEAGAEVERKGDQLFVRFIPVPGAVQLDAVEGVLDEWLTNGVWRVRATNPRSEDGFFKLDFEIRNASKATLSPAVDTGAALPQLFSGEGGIIDSLPRSDAHWGELVSPNLPPASGGMRTLEWFPKGGATPDKLLIRFEMNPTRDSILKKKGAAFIVPHPNFRISLRSS